jgi:hypothetical protein
LLVELEDDENQNSRDLYEVPKKRGKRSVGDATIIGDDNETSSEEGIRSPLGFQNQKAHLKEVCQRGGQDD